LGTSTSICLRIASTFGFAPTMVATVPTISALTCFTLSAGIASISGSTRM